MSAPEAEQAIKSAYNTTLKAATRHGFQPVFDVNRKNDHTGYDLTQHLPRPAITKPLTSLDLPVYGEGWGEIVSLQVGKDLTFWDNPSVVIVEQGALLISDNERAGITWGHILKGEITPNSFVLRLGIYPRNINRDIKRVWSLAQAFINCPDIIDAGQGVEVVAYTRVEQMVIRSAQLAMFHSQLHSHRITGEFIEDSLLASILEQPFFNAERLRQAQTA